MPALRDPKGVTEVVAIILLVAITVVLTGVLYLIVVGLSGNIQEVPPRVALTQTSNVGGVATFAVSAADVRPFAAYQLRLWINGSLDSASTLSPLSATSRGNLTYQDVDGLGTVTTGDQVFVSTVPGRSYEVFLLWTGNVVAHEAWP